MFRGFKWFSEVARVEKPVETDLLNYWWILLDWVLDERGSLDWPCNSYGRFGCAGTQSRCRVFVSMISQSEWSDCRRVRPFHFHRCKLFFLQSWSFCAVASRVGSSANGNIFASNLPRRVLSIHRAYVGLSDEENVKWAYSLFYSKPAIVKDYSLSLLHWSPSVFPHTDTFAHSFSMKSTINDSQPLHFQQILQHA